MKPNSYERTIETTATAQQVYDALTTGIQHWWTVKAGKFENVGDVAKFAFNGINGYWTFKAKTLSTEKVELECVDALHIHEGLPKAIEKEWLGTNAIWDITEEDGTTKIKFVHDGLTPDLLCYDVCEAGWDMFFVDSLKAYLDTGTGSPHS